MKREEEEERMMCSLFRLSLTERHLPIQQQKPYLLNLDSLPPNVILTEANLTPHARVLTETIA